MSDAVLLLPGLLCDRRLYAGQLPALEARASVTVGDLTGDETVDALADRILAAAPARFALAGLSMGGYVAFAILRRAPERVTRLALLDTQARADTDAAKARRRALMALAEQGEFLGVTPRLLPLFVHPAAVDDPHVAGAVRTMAERIGKDAFLRQQRAIMARPDSRPDLAAIACPTLILAGREDQLTPPELQLEMASAIPDATLVLIPRCGHLSPLERPEAVTRQLVAWLDG